MVFEAMSRVHWNAFVQWTIYENHNWRLESLNEALEDLYHDVHGWTNSSPPSDVNDRLKVYKIFTLSKHSCSQVLNLLFRIICIAYNLTSRYLIHTIFGEILGCL